MEVLALETLISILGTGNKWGFLHAIKYAEGEREKEREKKKFRVHVILNVDDSFQS